MNKYIKEGKDFSIETTLAGGNAIRQMHKAKEGQKTKSDVYIESI
ncbi:hypothetical protein [Fredinandcohnia quinoae]|nr:hypothetical protein [Fredinandcohnia sp. SECRCQ15]